MDENFTKDIEQEKNDTTISNTTTTNAESSEDEKSNALGCFFFILIVGVIIWFLFFRVPAKVTTKMIESDNIVEVITEKEIVRQLEDSYLTCYIESSQDVIVEKCVVSVSIPVVVKENPENYQTGDRYKVDDGYAFPIELPLKLNLTYQCSDGEHKLNPIDIDVSGSIVYHTEGIGKGHCAFREVNVEYDEDFMDLLDLSEIYASFAEFVE